MNWGPRSTMVKAQFQSGYTYPMLSTQSYHMGHHSAYEYANVDGPDSEWQRPDYIRLRTGLGPGRYTGSKMEDYPFYSRLWEQVDSRPMASDIITEQTSARSVVAHNGTMSAKTIKFTQPQGANNLWMDGHVQWNRWTGVTNSEYRRIASNYNQPINAKQELWAAPGGAYWHIQRSGPRVWQAP